MSGVVAVDVKMNPRQRAEAEVMLRELPRGVERVIQRSVPRATRETRTAAVRSVTRQVRVRQSDLYKKGNKRKPIQERIKGRGAQTSRRVTLGRGRMELGRFGAKQVWRKRKGKRFPGGTRYRIAKRGKSTLAKNLFTVTYKSGHREVFHRVGKGRNLRDRSAVVEAYGPSVPQVGMVAPGVVALRRGGAAKIYGKHVEDSVNFLLRRFGRA